jgi:hypothetical protein
MALPEYATKPQIEFYIREVSQLLAAGGTTSLISRSGHMAKGIGRR